MTTTFRVGERLLAEIDEIAESRKESRNTTINHALRLLRDTVRDKAKAEADASLPVKPKK